MFVLLPLIQMINLFEFNLVFYSCKNLMCNVIVYVKKISKVKFFDRGKHFGLLVDLYDINVFYNNLNNANASKAIAILDIVRDMTLWSHFHVNYVKKVT
jgi:hypothetical protein